MAIEIVDLPIKMVSFPINNGHFSYSYVNVYQEDKSKREFLARSHLGTRHMKTRISSLHF